MRSHFQPIFHGAIGLSSVMIDGETHRAKLFAKAALERMDIVLKYKAQSPSSEKCEEITKMDKCVLICVVLFSARIRSSKKSPPRS